MIYIIKWSISVWMKIKIILLFTTKQIRRIFGVPLFISIILSFFCSSFRTSDKQNGSLLSIIKKTYDHFQRVELAPSLAFSIKTLFSNSVNATAISQICPSDSFNSYLVSICILSFIHRTIIVRKYELILRRQIVTLKASLLIFIWFLFVLVCERIMNRLIEKIFILLFVIIITLFNGLLFIIKILVFWIVHQLYNYGKSLILEWYYWIITEIILPWRIDWTSNPIYSKE